MTLCAPASIDLPASWTRLGCTMKLSVCLLSLRSLLCQCSHQPSMPIVRILEPVHTSSTLRSYELLKVSTASSLTYTLSVDS